MRKRSNKTKDVPQDREERTTLLQSLLNEEFGDAAPDAADVIDHAAAALAEARAAGVTAATRKQPLRPDHPPLDAQPATKRHQIN